MFNFPQKSPWFIFDSSRICLIRRQIFKSLTLDFLGIYDLFFDVYEKHVDFF